MDKEVQLATQQRFEHEINDSCKLHTLVKNKFHYDEPLCSMYFHGVAL